MRPKERLRRDIERTGLVLSDDEWLRLSPSFSECTFAMGDIILSSTRVADRWLFLGQGIVASQQPTPKGDVLIARFFEPGQFCANMTSTWTQKLAMDELVAITDVEGVLIPDRLFRDQFLRGAVFGEYLRLKCMETLIFDKDVLYAKTSNDTEVQYRFLEDTYSRVIEHTAQKDLARFIGVTPQGLNRFLRRRVERQMLKEREPKEF
ncbi:MAG: hypothetical protein AAFR73_08645 [Pseudomonadota bacterium]